MRLKLVLFTFTVSLFFVRCNITEPVSISSSNDLEKAAFIGSNQNYLYTIRSNFFMGNPAMFMNNPGNEEIEGTYNVSRASQFQLIPCGNDIYSIKSMNPYTPGSMDYRFLSVQDDGSIIANKTTNSTNAEKFKLTYFSNTNSYEIKSLKTNRYVSCTLGGIYATYRYYFTRWDINLQSYDVAGAYTFADNMFEWDNLLLNYGNSIILRYTKTDNAPVQIGITINGQPIYPVGNHIWFTGSTNPVDIIFSFSDNIVFEGFDFDWALTN